MIPGKTRTGSAWNVPVVRQWLALSTTDTAARAGAWPQMGTGSQLRDRGGNGRCAGTVDEVSAEAEGAGDGAKDGVANEAEADGADTPWSSRKRASISERRFSSAVRDGSRTGDEETAEADEEDNEEDEGTTYTAEEVDEEEGGTEADTTARGTGNTGFAA